VRAIIYFWFDGLNGAGGWFYGRDPDDYNYSEAGGPYDCYEEALAYYKTEVEANAESDRV
jgi:hypothetical protein